jgi:hypothetical protein
LPYKGLVDLHASCVGSKQVQRADTVCAAEV